MLALVLGCVLFLGAASRAQEAARPADATRARLEALTQAERLRLARNLEQFERLPPRTKTKLLERARVLRERERAFGRAAASEPLARQRGDEALQEAGRLWRAWLRERGREVRERLPERVLQRLERASPEARRRSFERLFEAQERLGGRVFTKACQRLGLPPREVERLERMPPREQLRALRELYAARSLSAR